MYNPLQTPGCFKLPERLSGVTPWIPHIPFAFALVEALRPRMFVELGTHRGDSYCAFCQAIKDLQLPARCFAVDTWQGDEHAGVYGPEVLGELIEHHDPRYGSFSELLPMTFDEAHGGFLDGTIDLLHIDGLHTYEAVKHDFDRWLPKLSDRGVVLFHDILVRERDFGVWQLWEELSLIYPHFALNHAYGLGVLIVGEHAPPEVHELAVTAATMPGFDRFFDMLGARVSLVEKLSTHEAWIREQDLMLHTNRAEIEHRGAQLAHSQQQHGEAQQEVQGCRSEIERLGHVIGNQQAELGRQTAFIEQLNAEKAAAIAAQEELSLRQAETTISQAQTAAAQAALVTAHAAHVNELTQRLNQVTAELAETDQALSAAKAEIERSIAQLGEVRGYYAQLRFRMADRLNRGLRRTGGLHAAVKSMAKTAARLVRRSSAAP